jgi:hypothetical protein
MFAGSCLCGAVAFEADAPAAQITFCNCSKCRRASGTAFAAIMSVPRAVALGEGRERARDSSPGKIRRFCGRCGSLMTSEPPGNAEAAVRVRLGTLDTPVDDPRFAGHIWRSEAADWYDPKRSVPGWPEFAAP